MWGIFFNIIRLLNIAQLEHPEARLNLFAGDIQAKFKQQSDGRLNLSESNGQTNVKEQGSIETFIYRLLEGVRNRTPKLLQAKRGKGELEWRFLRFYLSVFLIMFLFPVGAGEFLLHAVRCWWFNEVTMALIGTISLIGLLSIAEALTRLGALAQVRWWVCWLVRVPGLLVVLFVFVGNSIENGQGVLNDNLSSWEKQSAVGTTFSLLPLQANKSRPSVNKFGKDTGKMARHKENPAKKPLVIFCVSGGGTRAAMFTAGILTRMWQQKEDTAILQQNKDPYPGRRLLENVNVMSGVSGGGLALAYFQEGLYRWLRNHRPKGGVSDKSAALQNRHDALEWFFGVKDQTECRPLVTWYSQDQEQIKPNDLAHYAFNPTGRGSKLGEDFDINPYMNAMRQNFVAPCVAGYFWPWTGRGPSYEDTWERAFQWYDTDPLHPRRIGDFRDYEKTGHLPTLILNALLTRTGSRLAITNLDAADFAPLEKFGPPVDTLNDSPDTRENLRYDPTPDTIITLHQLDPTWNMPLQAAVHATANFPYALPTMRIVRKDVNGTHQHLHTLVVEKGKEKKKDVTNWLGKSIEDVWEAIDGGGVNNYGTDAPMALLRQYHQRYPKDCRRGAY